MSIYDEKGITVSTAKQNLSVKHQKHITYLKFIMFAAPPTPPPEEEVAKLLILI